MTTQPGLTSSQRTVLDFERRWWRGAGAKQQAIHDELSLTETRYYELLSELIDHPSAMEAEPALVNRLRRARDERRRRRTSTQA